MRIANPLLIVFAILLVGCPPAAPIDQVGKVIVPDDESVPIRKLVSETLESNRKDRTLSVDVHGAWQVMHGVLAYGADFEVQTAEGPQPAIEYLLQGGELDGFDPRPGDAFGTPPRQGVRLELQPDSKIGQGHRDQWLAVLLQSGIRENAELSVGDSRFTIRDWLNQIQYDTPLNVESEFSWTLIALTALDPTTQRWLARDGQYYNVESLLNSELSQPYESSVCGGTHRLIGIAMALAKRRQEGNPMTTAWLQADELISRAIDSAKGNQNPDGSYSTNYLQRPGPVRDLGEALGTTGHVVEFLAIAAPDEVIREPWVQRSVRCLCQILKRCEGVDLECGSLYHALHGLVMYRQRLDAMQAE